MNEFYQSVLEGIAEEFPDIDPSDEAGSAIKRAKVLRRAGEELGESRAKINRALLYLLCDVEREKTYLFDGSEADSLTAWAESIPTLNAMLEDKQDRDYLLRMISSVVTMAIPIEMMNIPNPRAIDEDGALIERNITAEDIIDSGNKIVKEITSHFKDAETDEEREEIAIAMVKGEGKAKLADLREKKKDIFVAFKFTLRIDPTTGNYLIFGELPADSFDLFEARTKGLVEYEYEPGEGPSEADPYRGSDAEPRHIG
jgi:hypothetical protein